MTTHEQDQALSNLTLGKPTAYHDRYDNSLLQAVPRSLNREPLGLFPDSLPFTGSDIWTLYELSWLNSKGLPQVAVGEVVLDAQSRNLIESKSFKLYLNSFNQTRFADWGEVRQTLERDLSACAEGEARVALFRLNEIEGQPIGHFEGCCIDEQDIAIDDYRFNADYLADAAGSEIVEETLVSHLLKSNCLITNQPDWGSVMIRYKGSRNAREALLRNQDSFCQHNEFHEQRAEWIYNDVMRDCYAVGLLDYVC